MKRLFLELIWRFKYTLFRKKTKLTPRENPVPRFTFLEHSLDHLGKGKVPSQTSIVLNVIRKYFIYTDTFTSSELFFYCQTEGFSLTRKQVWKTIYKLQVMGLVEKIVLGSSNEQKYPYYRVNLKLANEWLKSDN